MIITIVLGNLVFAQDYDCEVTKEMNSIPDDLYVEIYPVIITAVDELQESFDSQLYLGYSFEIDGE